ncbi:hypothetical protein [Actinomadura sp. WAC 06369]|uniref:hypothetical protein n=1 Tax=Actinomadura sp. WAC 06369 TaxID=2203193 RepID=UPI000F7947AD|nr:hypothetical protein [Actinomadura sp. WAC 06369]
MSWVRLPDGTVRWGRHGAAGLLLTARGHVLLACRSSRVDHGGTWAYLGGARLYGAARPRLVLTTERRTA